MSLAQRCSGIANRAASLGQQNHNSQERRGFDNEQHETTLRYRVAVNDDLERIRHQPLGELRPYRRQEGEQQNREPPHERSPQSIGAAAGLKSRRPLRYHHSIARLKYRRPRMSCLPTHWRSNALGGVSHNYPMGSATNFIVSAVFTRISTACLPCDLASDSHLRTSLALPTVLPPTSRMISPDWKPCSAAEPAGSTSVTITPSPPEPDTSSAGAKLNPR